MTQLVTPEHFPFEEVLERAKRVSRSPFVGEVTPLLESVIASSLAGAADE